MFALLLILKLSWYRFGLRAIKCTVAFSPPSRRDLGEYVEWSKILRTKQTMQVLGCHD